MLRSWQGHSMKRLFTIVASLIMTFLLLLKVPAMALAYEPTTAGEYFKRGRLNEEGKAYDQALADYSKAIELEPSFIDAYFSRSSLYTDHPDIAKNSYAKAVADLTKIVELLPNDFCARFNRG